MEFREFIEAEERRDESLLGIAKSGWNAAKSVGNAAVGAARMFDGITTVADEALAKAVGAGTKGRMTGGYRQFGRGARQFLYGDPGKKTAPKEPQPEKPEPQGEREWHYKRDGKTHGPFASDELRAMAGDGRLLHDDLIWRKGMQSWRRAGDAKKLFPSPYPPLKRAQPAKPTPAPEPEKKEEPSVADPIIRDLWARFHKAGSEEERNKILFRIARLGGQTAADLIKKHRNRGRPS